MPRVLIAGCGYVGEAAANRFHESGWEAEGWTASRESAEKLSNRPYPVRAADVATAEASREFDVVIHCVSSRGGDEQQYRRLYFEGARNLLRAFSNATLLFTSSTSVYAQSDGSLVDENSPAEPSHTTGRILRETEDLVLAAGGIVLRLGGIHGPNRSFFLTRFLESAASERDDRLINQVHRDDIVSALTLLAERRVEHGGEIFNVVGDQPVTASDAQAWLSSRLKSSSPSIAVTPRLAKRGRSNKRVSNRKLRALGWAPRYPTFEIAM
ncbi:MAG TPA: NAD-dependent epimerase/dehydratase family protein, partial [Chthoniobacterales bacterium]